jgi:putative transposase
MRHLVEAHRCSERRACAWSASRGRSPGIGRGAPTIPGCGRDSNELAGERRRFGYLRLHALLRREGLVINPKKTYRLYKAEVLTMRPRRRRRPAERERLRLVVAQLRNQRWSMDFASHGYPPASNSGSNLVSLPTAAAGAAGIEGSCHCL